MAHEQHPAVTATRLYISGGSHRSALGGLGAILYLLDSTGAFQWGNVDEVVAVSGGTQPVAALAAAGASNTDEVSATMRRLYEAIHRDQLRLTTPRRLLILLACVLTICAPLVLWALFAAFDPWAALVFPVGLVTFAVVYRSLAWLLSILQQDYLRVILRASCTDPRLADRRLDELPATTNLYVMVAVGLDSALMYPAWIGPGAPTTSSDRAVQAISPIQACLASSSLPPMGRLRSPKMTSSGKKLQRREPLIDGGVGGNFGFQLSEQIADEIVAGNGTSMCRHSLTVDAGRRIKPSTGPIAEVRRASTSARLMRWVQVAGDALYLNDLDDMKRLGPVLGGTVDVAEGAAPLAAWTEAPPQIHAPTPTDVATTQSAAIEANSKLGLFGLSDETIPLAIACGVVGSLLTDRAAQQSTGTPDEVTMCEAESALAKAGERLIIGLTLVAAWKLER